jgi:Secretion system C-terminal sorting domain
MKILKYTLTLWFLAIHCITTKAQCFQTTMTQEGADLVVKIRPDAALTTGFANMEFYVRYPNSATITWGNPVVNTTDFPNVVIQKNDPYTTITESGFTIVRFFLPPGTFGGSKTHTAGTAYEVFRVSATGTAALEMMHQDAENPYVLTLVNEAANTEWACATKFYGGATSVVGGTQSLRLAIVLPVELTDFKGQNTEGGNFLTWETAVAKDLSYFLLEKSTHSKKDFQTIGKIAAQPNATPPQYFQFLDAHPADLTYYRLKMVDENGQFSLSKTIALARTSTKNQVVIYPNPARSVLNIQSNPSNFQKATVQLMDVAGKMVVQQAFLNPHSTLNLDIQNLSAGLYTLIVQIDGQRSEHKVVITP